MCCRGRRARWSKLWRTSRRSSPLIPAGASPTSSRSSRSPTRMRSPTWCWPRSTRSRAWLRRTPILCTVSNSPRGSSGGKTMRRFPAFLQTLPLLGLFLLIPGCSSTPAVPQPSDTAEVTLPAPAEKVRVAVIELLTANGYAVREEERDGRILTTGYREEMDSPWDWMLRTRFGVGRSLVVATVTPEGETATRLTMRVTYESKNRILDSWTESTPPLQHSAANNIRLIQNALGLL